MLFQKSLGSLGALVSTTRTSSSIASFASNYLLNPRYSCVLEVVHFCFAVTLAV